MNNNGVEEKEEDFATLLENSFTQTKSFVPGQVIEAEIVSISGGCVFLQLDGKSEGQIDAEELLDKDGNITVKEGDMQKAYFLSAQNGDMLFTTRISGNKAGKDALKSAFEAGIPLEGTVDSVIKGGFDIKIGESRAFCPFSQMGLKRVQDSQEYVGTKHTFKIIEYGENGRNILVSSRVLLEEEKQQKLEVLKNSLKEKMTVVGTVKSLQDFGAFVEIQGVQALLPISEISRSRIDDIKKYLTVGQEIETSIIKLDWKTERITLSIKALIKDPWVEAEIKYPCDSRHKGIVARITNFGAFVTLESGLDGLIHISELDGDELKKGQKVNVQIRSIDTAGKRIALKQVSSDQENAVYKQYMEEDNDTYNPFADLFKK